MAGASLFLTRVFAQMFPGTMPSTQQSAPAPSPSPAQPESPAPNSSTAPRTVGLGAPNEFHVLIDGIPNLFVDEGDCIVQFEPAFDNHTEDTDFGLKILPDLVPHWSQKAEHRVSLKEAIATAIRSAGRPVVQPSNAKVVASDSTMRQASRGDDLRKPPSSPEPGDDEQFEPRERSPRRTPQAASHAADAVTGSIAWWGEEKFPDRKSKGSRFYMSFAMHLDTVSGERTLQGEGLKDAITESGCVVGDVVTVRRLRKVKVPAFRNDGSPKIVNGQQVMWDKWLWSIEK
ncbi:hypothetical protein [Paraburkholderia phenazinium]|uniref:hypothetical protein n=1 Tax=Paraburkholderia phenazinium TaxID=60549 RepID=UPI00158E31CE|nr:hypothetical protein [Paraburkholderia phenazinium]